MDLRGFGRVKLHFVYLYWQKSSVANLDQIKVNKTRFAVTLSWKIKINVFLESKWHIMSIQVQPISIISIWGIKKGVLSFTVKLSKYCSFPHFRTQWVSSTSKSLQRRRYVILTFIWTAKISSRKEEKIQCEKIS